MTQLIVNTLVSCAIYSLIGQGFYLSYKTHKFLNLGHGAPVVIGGYAVFLFSKTFFGASLSGLLWCIITATLVSGLFGLGLDQTLYRFLRKKKQPALALFIISLGVLTVVQSIIALFFQSQYRVVDVIGSFSNIVHIGSAANTWIQIFTIIIGIIVLPLLWLMIRKTNFGKAFRAISDDAEVSAIVGIPVERVLAKISFVSAAFAGLAGALIAIDTGINPQMGFTFLLKGIVAVIAGGLGSFGGPVLGSLIISFLENSVVISIGAQWRDVAVYALLLLFLLIRPQGILSGKK